MHKTPPPPLHRFVEAAGMLLTVILLWLALRQTGVFAFSASVEGAASLGAIVVIGLISAGSTCLAVVGGLLLSVSAQWAQTNPKAGRWTKLRPLLLFNLGRLLGYFLLGGLVGLIGTALTPSVRINGIVTIAIAMVMILLGLRLLQIVPKRYCTIPLPKAMRARLQELSHSHNVFSPIFLGALTFFVPCGFTQSMQLLALASGGFLQGGLIMLAFAVGTLPALLGISVIGSLLEGRLARIFIGFAGAVVVLLGFFNLKHGLVLSGLDPLRMIINNTTMHPTSDANVTRSPDGRQIISLSVSDDGYSPASFVIDPGVETWVYASAKRQLSGCANFLTAPAYNLSVPINVGANWLGPIRNPKNDFLLTCSQGRLRANVYVR